ncbi:MAG: Obg family GTPase CgtA, partial [Chloroflexi bacterium]|nr:Obg family GTPase CgtA [Chloroflexota bacterium]
PLIVKPRYEGSSKGLRKTSLVTGAQELAQQGQAGEEGTLTLEMALAPDIAIIGMPNSGKSTLLHRLTGVQARIADYAFTTKEVIKGIYEREGKTYLVIETPGIVEGAHTGKGLGLAFARHLRKARVLVHLVDGSSPDAAGDIERVRRELAAHDPGLLDKPEVVAINRIDLPEVRNAREGIRDRVGHRRGSLIFISALTGEGLEGLMDAVVKLADLVGPTGAAVEAATEEPATIVLLPEGKRPNVVYRKKGVVVIEAPELEEVLKRTDILHEDAQAYMKRQFHRTGVARLLRKEGVKIGDRVRCGGVEWEWQWPL